MTRELQKIKCERCGKVRKVKRDPFSICSECMSSIEAALKAQSTPPQKQKDE